MTLEEMLTEYYNVHTEKDALEIYVDGDNIILHKFCSACVFCGSTDGLVSFKERYICAACAEELKK